MGDETFALGVTYHRLWGLIILPFILLKNKEDLFYTYSNITTINNEDPVFQKLKDEEKKVLKLVNDYSDRQLFKIFSKHKNVREFHEKVTKENIDSFIRPFIEKRISEILQIAIFNGIKVFNREKTTSKIFSDDFFKLEKTPVEPVFQFIKKDEGSVYTLRLKKQGEVISLVEHNIEVLSNFPAFIILNKTILRVNKIEAKKLKPFILKEQVFIPASAEIQYFKSFLKNIIRNYEVYAEGFDIINLKPEKEVKLSLEKGLDSRLVLVLRFRYQKKLVFPASKETVFVDFTVDKGTFKFYRYKRDEDFEKKYIVFLEERGLTSYDGNNFLYINNDSFDDQESDYRLIEWINNNSEKIRNAGFILEQRSAEFIYYSGKIELLFDKTLVSDWFDIKAVIKLDNLEIPFLNLRKHILNGERKYILPDNTIFIIPSEWFTKYKDIVQFSRISGQKLKLHKQYFMFLKETPEGNKSSGIHELVKIDKRDSSLFKELPEKLLGTLRPYQIEGYTWLWYLQKNGLGGCLADDMGLGKTIQTLAIILKNKEDQLPSDQKPSFDQTRAQLSLFETENSGLTSLIVVPASLVHNWINEIRKFAPLLKVYAFFGNQRQKDLSFFKNFDILISSYHTVRQDIDFLVAFNFHYIILDESQIIKNPNSQIYKSVEKLRADHRLVLTGTPIENSLTDLWAQMNFINRGLLGSLNFFRQKYVYPIEKKGEEQAAEKLKELVRPYILRRTKTEVAVDLPGISDQLIYCNMTEEQRKYYEEEKSGIRNLILENIDKNGIEKSAVIVLQGLTKLRQIANHPVLIDHNYYHQSGKFDEILRNVGNIIAEGHKLLVFSSFVKHLELLKNELIKEKIDYSLLTGSSINREKIINEFQENKDCKIFLISLKAGGFGLNLTSADYVFILEPWWNPASELQAISRSHRIGQKKNVFVYRFISENSIEEKIHNLQEKKNKIANTFVTSNNPIKDLSKNELEELFS